MNPIDSTMSEEGNDQQNSGDSEPRKSVVIQGQYFSTPLPVYSSDSSDSYETDDETDFYPSSLPHLARLSQVATKRPKRTSMDSILSLDYEYETDSDSSQPSNPPIQEGSSTGLTKKESQDSLGATSYYSMDSAEYETDSDSSQEPLQGFSNEGTSKLPPADAVFNSFLASYNSLDSVDESYETDHSSDDEHDDEPAGDGHPLHESNNNHQRTPLDPDAHSPTKRQLSTFESSSPMRRLQEELDMAREHMEKWKASSQTLEQELQQKTSEESTDQQHLLLRLQEHESDKESYEDTIRQLGNQVAELQHLLAIKRAEGEQTMTNQPPPPPPTEKAGKATHSRNNSRDSIAVTVLNALGTSTDSEKVDALEQEIREAREVITTLDRELNKLDKSSRSIILEKDEQIEALQAENQELLASQNALKQQNESLDAHLARKEAMLTQKDQEIASLKEVIRKKDDALQSQAASLELLRQDQQLIQTEASKDEGSTDGDEVVAVNELRATEWMGGNVPKGQKQSKRRSYKIKEPALASQDDTPPVKSPLESPVPPSETTNPTTSTTVSSTLPPLPTPTASNDTGDTVPSAQEQMEYDLDQELDTLQTKVHEMMTETVLLTDLVDQKDAELRDAKRRLDILQAENAKLRQEEETESQTPTKLHTSQESRTARQLEIAALQAELEVEKMRRRELEERLASGSKKESKNDDADDDSSVSISDDEENLADVNKEAALEETLEQTAQEAQSDSDTFEDSPIPATRVFGQEGKFYAKPQAAATTTTTTLAPPPNDATVGQYTRQEMAHLFRLIRKRDQGIQILRDKLMEQESLISLLNKTLSTKDTKLERLERLLRGKHPQFSLKVLEENDRTMDNLVMYRMETEQLLTSLQEQIRELEDQVRASKETDYQLRRRTEELASAESQIRHLKADLKLEVSTKTQLIKQHHAQMDHLRDETTRLEHKLATQVQDFDLQLAQKEDLIHSIHAEATEKGLLMDSLEASLKQSTVRLQTVETQASRQKKKISHLQTELAQYHEEQSQWIQIQQDKDELIQLLNDSRLEGQRIIESLQKKMETSRPKRTRKHYSGKKETAYMEPFVLDLHQAQIEYDRARKNLRLAHARERLVRPAGSKEEEEAVHEA